MGGGNTSIEVQVKQHLEVVINYLVRMTNSTTGYTHDIGYLFLITNQLQNQEHMIPIINNCGT